jgi:hypothetical protein
LRHAYLSHHRQETVRRFPSPDRHHSHFSAFPFHFGVAELFNSIENSRAGTSNCCSRANNASSFAPSDATGIVSPFELMELLGAGASCLRCILCVHDMDWAVVGVSKTMRRASVLDLRV